MEEIIIPLKELPAIVKIISLKRSSVRVPNGSFGRRPETAVVDFVLSACCFFKQRVHAVQVDFEKTIL